MPADPLKAFLASYPPEIRALSLAARELILSVCRDAVETVRPGWKTIGYGTGRGMKETVLALGPARGHVSILFPAGAGLPDPAGLLEGAGARMRHVKVRDQKELGTRAVRDLVKAAFARETAPRAPAKAPAPKVSDGAVKKETGRSWGEWKALLDAEGAAALGHKGIVAILSRRHGLGPWWQQTVAIGYEKLSAIRERNQPAARYQVGVSRTVAVALPRLWAAWTEPRTRRRWLPDTAFVIRKATEGKSLRVTWADGSNLEVQFAARGKERSQVTVDHRKLPPGPAVTRMRAFWKERLDALRAQLEA